MFTIKTLNNISNIGLAELDADICQLDDNSDTPHALLVRSHNMHDMEIANSVEVVGRAGAGTNNIPIEKLTNLGIPVFNTPGANANAVKELVITGMLLACRNICPAWDYARNLKGDDDTLHAEMEKHKKTFAGFELPGRTLGVVGLGHIGIKVANTALDLGMNVIGFDPAMTVRNAWELSSNVQQAEKMAEVFAQADFISFHIPLNEHTRGIIDAAAIKSMKAGVVILNFARGGIIDNQALLAAIESEHVRNYVCDFPVNLFQQHPQVISLPHLGASTQEAEENCAKMISQQVQDYLLNGNIKYSVNFPALKLPRNDGQRIAIVNANIPNMVAQISTVLSKHDINIIDMINKSRDNIAYTLMDVASEVTAELLAELRAIDGVIRARLL